MSYSKDTIGLHVTAEDLKDLKLDFLATAFHETRDQLLLCQKGRYLKAAKSNKCRKILYNSTVADISKSVPCAKILDDIKIDQELKALIKIYQQACEILTKDNIDPHNPFTELRKIVETRNQNSNELEDLLKELEENKSTLNDLKDVEIKKQAEYLEILSQKSQSVKDLREQLTNIKRLNRLEVRLVEKWENNRLSQAKLVGEKKERLLMQEILELHRRMAGEQRFICEIKSFRNNEMSELKSKIVDWEKKFEEETAEITRKNLTLAQNIDDVVKLHEKHFEIAQKRKMFVSEYLERKAVEQRLYEEQCHRIACAIRIQAWWRGVMVRRGLGPYSKKSKKGKKTKGKK